MNENVKYKTEQEAFWAGKFGTDYINRNNGNKLLASNLNFFTKALNQAGRLDSCVELGANIGMNLRALKLLYPHLEQYGVEINADAARELGDFLGSSCVFNGSLFDWKPEKSFDLALIKGVLIHINPDMLPTVYQTLYEASSRFILVAEYYNPSPVVIPYRNHTDRLFKRDFAGELMDAYSDLELLDYGFSYHRDTAFPQDDITWFLLEKHS